MGTLYWSGCDQKLVQNPALPLTRCVTLGELLCLSVPHYLHLKLGITVPCRVGIRMRQCIYKVFRTILAYTKTSKISFFSDLPPGVGEYRETGFKRGALSLGIQARAAKLQLPCPQTRDIAMIDGQT